jgi:hypothetical protein
VASYPRRPFIGLEKSILEASIDWFLRNVFPGKELKKIPIQNFGRVYLRLVLRAGWNGRLKHL